MDRYAVIGQPVAHSQSPRIHAQFAQQAGEQISYQAIEVAPADLGARLQELHAQGYGGLNLTLPHKAAGAAACVSVSAAAQRAGAVNTLVRREHGWHGENTDGPGLVRDLVVNLATPLAGQRILVLGAGGAARGIIEPLLLQAPAELVLSGRTPWKAEEIAAAFKSLGPIRPSTHLALKGDRFDLVLNATSAGHQGEAPRLPAGLFAPAALAYDLNYGRAAAPFLAWAQAQSAARASDGLGMLVEQAAEAYQFWRGRRPETAAVLALLRMAANAKPA